MGVSYGYVTRNIYKFASKNREKFVTYFNKRTSTRPRNIFLVFNGNIFYDFDNKILRTFHYGIQRKIIQLWIFLKFEEFRYFDVIFHMFSSVESQTFSTYNQT